MLRYVYQSQDEDDNESFFLSMQIYDPTDKIRLLEPGLHVLRAYASEPKKLSSDIVTSRYA